MPTVVIPYRGAGGKSRLALPTPAQHEALVEAMLADVADASRAVGPTFVVAPAPVSAPGVTSVPDPGRGQGAAVEAGLAAALAGGSTGPLLVVNADLPCTTPRDLLALAGKTPVDGIAVVAARDGTTNALALASPALFAPLYGPGSAARFGALAASCAVDAPNLIDDVDTVADLERLASRLGPHTRALLAALRTDVAA
jgi:2-phospho-L-lactate guanylyltransferase